LDFPAAGRAITNAGLGSVEKRILPSCLDLGRVFNGSDGVLPESSLVQSIDGNFYGTTHSGGAYGYGTAGATTGKVKVKTPHGTLTGNVNFRVT
jgi:hypothetical protein